MVTINKIYSGLIGWSFKMPNAPYSNPWQTLGHSMHKPYIEILNHRCDFKVRYRFYDESEGGRKTLPHQGIRSDFWYEHDDHKDKRDCLFMIWPEFENSNGELIKSGEVLKEGIAHMWIINPELREYHQKRIKTGMTGFFKEGSKSTGKCEIIDIVDLMINPIKK